MKKLLLLNLLILSACASNGEFIVAKKFDDLLDYMADPNGDKQKLQEQRNAINANDRIENAENDRIATEKAKERFEEIKKNYTSIQVVEQCTASARAVKNSSWGGPWSGISEEIYNLEAIGENYYKTKGIRVSTFYSNVEKIEKAYYSLIPSKLVQNTSFRNPQEEKYQYAVWAYQFVYPKAIEKYYYFSCSFRSYGDYIR